MKKQIMSIAAAAAILTTGAMAFDSYEYSNGNNNIVTDVNGAIVKSSYTGANALPSGTINKSADQKGDALIYPLYSSADGYQSEVVVRNTSKNAIVAKVVFYSAKDSRELRDFNIYLSGYDVFRFTVKDGKIVSSDGSVIVASVLESDVDIYNAGTVDDYKNLKFASTTSPFSASLSEDKGYIAVFGMIESDDKKDSSGLAFHNKHDDLYAAYAHLLDTTRGTLWRNWRLANGKLNPSYMVGSMFTGSGLITAPNVDISATGSAHTWKEKGKADHTADFTGVSSVLTGHITLTNPSTTNDLLLPATAINDFSEDNDNTVMWTPGEYASIADRCIDHDATGAFYDVTCVAADAAMLNVTTATYTYAHNGGTTATDNRVYITQPYKRTLLQIDPTVNYGYTYVSTKTSRKVETGAKSFFTTTASVYDEAERTTADPVKTVGSVGPALSGDATDNTTTPAPTGYVNEVEMIRSDAFEHHATTNTQFGKGNGFAKFNVGVSSIITQMVASTAGDSIETNWIYSDSTK
jgi:hypothetical protein